MEKLKSVHRFRTIYGTEINRGRIFLVLARDETTATLQDKHGAIIYVAMDEIKECFVHIL